MVLSCIGTTRASLCYFPIPSFYTCCAFQLENIHHHHSLEETFYFPAMEEKLGKGVLSGNIKEHEEFVPNLEALDEWCKKVQKGEVVYDGNVFLGMVNSFADTMVAHMTHVRFGNSLQNSRTYQSLITIGAQNFGPRYHSRKVYHSRTQSHR